MAFSSGGMANSDDVGSGLYEGLEPEYSKRALRRLDVTDAEVFYCASFFSQSESDEFFRRLLHESNWKQEQIKLFGKSVDIPRLTAWYGDAGKSYTYSGITVNPHSWSPTLLRIKQAIEASGDVVFNSVLLNLYRDGRDSVAWHADDEPELGQNPPIGSVSLGEQRVFQLRHKRDKKLRLSLPLLHGSYLLMTGPTQHNWVHQIPKNSTSKKPRINLTFRIIH
jgi:alkylated DNA repair dioxygenase AlkB